MFEIGQVKLFDGDYNQYSCARMEVVMNNNDVIALLDDVEVASEKTSLDLTKLCLSNLSQSNRHSLFKHNKPICRCLFEQT